MTRPKRSPVMVKVHCVPFQTNDLARTGDSEKTQILAELTLEVKNEAAHGIIADLSAT